MVHVKKSKLLITQSIIFSILVSFLLLALLGVLISPIVVYGKFIFLSFKFFILFVPILFLLLFVYGLIKAKKWSYIYGLILICLILLFDFWQLIGSINILSKNISSEYSVIKWLAIINLILVIISLVIFGASLYIQTKLKEELEH